MEKKHFDVIVVGSGAAGSFAAKELTERGLEILLLEAGPDITPADFKVPPPQKPKVFGIQVKDRAIATLNGQPIQSQTTYFNRSLAHLFVNDREHPYTTPKDAPFLWMRGKQLGGRLHTYGRMLVRWSDYDFKAASRDGIGIDWPIRYADLVPFYSRVEKFLGIYGREERLENFPDSDYVGRAGLNEAEEQFKASIESHWKGRTVTTWRYMPPDANRVPKTIRAARETGKVTIRTDAVVRRILTDDVSGKATGAEFIDRKSGVVEQVYAEVVVLAASPIETIRLMLNSSSGKHPRGLGNSSGVLGQYLMDHVPNLIMGRIPSKNGWEEEQTVAPDPVYGLSGGVYIPRYENLATRSRADFARGFAFQGKIGRSFMPGDQPGRYSFGGFGEMLPRVDNSVTLNSLRKDAWGVPIPHIRCVMSDNEIAMLAEQTRSIREMVQAAGLTIEFSGSSRELQESGTGAFPEADPISRFLFRRKFRSTMVMGSAIHECGGARMGADPSNSIVNLNNQCWDAPNVFVTDASCFPSSGCAGTTLTIMALTVRASEFIAANRGTL